MVARPSPRSASVLLALALLVGLASVGPAAAMPPPRPVCTACSTGFADAAADHGVSLSVTHSEARVAVHANGSATWTVRNRVPADAATRLDRDDTLESVAADAADGSLRGARLDGRTAVFRYRVEEFARPVAGALRVDYFRQDFAGANYDGLGADRLTVTAPAGWRVAKTVPGATVAAGNDRTVLTSYGAPGSFLTLVPHGALGGARSAAAVGLTLAPVVAANAERMVLFPAVLFGVAVVAAAAVLRRLFDLPDADAGGGRRVAGRALAAVVLVGAILAVAGSLGAPGALLVPVVALVAPLAFATAGYVLGRGRLWWAVAVAFCGFAVPMLVALPLARRPMGVSAYALLGLALALAAAFVATLLLAAGSWFAVESATGRAGSP